MPELPELVVYAERLTSYLKGTTIQSVHVHDPFVLRTTTPPLLTFVGRQVVGARRAGKELALETECGGAISFHLMRAGRLTFRRPAVMKRSRAKRARATFEFDDGATLELTEEGTKHRAALRAWERIGAFFEDAGGFDPLDPAFDAAAFGERLRSVSRQLKTALRDRTVVTGIGNAYSDEILFAARLSPMRLTPSLDDAQVARLAQATVDTLREWIERIRGACPEGLPTRQRDWRRGMAVHGRTGEPCPACGGTIAFVSFQERETNYCPACQNEGRLLADRRLSKFGIRRTPPRRPG